MAQQKIGFELSFAVYVIQINNNNVINYDYNGYLWLLDWDLRMGLSLKEDVIGKQLG